MSDIPASLAVDISYLARREREREAQAEAARKAQFGAALGQNASQTQFAQQGAHGLLAAKRQRCPTCGQHYGI